MAAEKDMTKMQLVDMCDKLPPLTKFTFGFKLDPWQIRVLKWIDAGKNVIICAPTSSGKTVLSSYAAFPKTKRFREKTDEEEKAEKLAAQREATRIIQDDASDDEVDEDDDDEEDNEPLSEDDENEDLNEELANLGSPVTCSSATQRPPLLIARDNRHRHRGYSLESQSCAICGAHRASRVAGGAYFLPH